jgi:hypothetical protein
MPGFLYFYINFWHILLNKTHTSKNKSLGRPLLRDLEWMISYAWCEARGFSGFDNDPEYHCNRAWKPKYEGNNLITPSPPEFFINGEKNPYFGKKYMEAKSYLKRIFTNSLGKPMWDNNAKNFMMMGARGYGKSYFVSGAVIAYEFLFHSNTQIVVGAGETKYSSDLLTKLKLGLDTLPGGIEYNNEYFPAPFYKTYTGSFQPGKSVTHQYDVKIGDSGWVKKGSRSSIKHITFKDNHMAANGTRPSILIMEEIGAFDNLMESHLSSKETMMNGAVKFGSGFYIGTGGDMNKGTVDAHRMFYDPDTYDILDFEDSWEGSGKIGYFIPAYLGLNQYKNENGETNIESARADLEKEREKLRRGKDKSALNMELQYRPIVPSEAFLSNTGNIFDLSEIKHQLNYLETTESAKYLGQVGRLDRDSEGKPMWVPDEDRKKLDDWPIKSEKDNSGAIVIYEHPPKEGIPYGLFIGGIDPYDHDRSMTGSVGACYIYKRFSDFSETYNLIVAEYVGRPPKAKEFYENCRRLLEYYGARALYENQTKGLHQYFESKNCTHLLQDQPDELIKDIVKDSKVQRGKGIHMSNNIKEYGELLTRDLLSEEFAEGKMNYRKIYSKGLLTELMNYNDDNNFDRAIAFFLVALYNQQLHKVHVKAKEERFINRDSFFEKPIFSKNL